MRAIVTIRPKDGILDPQGEAVKSSLAALGLAVTRARVGRIVELELSFDDPSEARVHLERVATELLANPLIESYEIDVPEDR